MKNVTLLNFSLNNKITENPAFYQNSEHLNAEGAKIFTQLLVLEINNQNILTQ